MPESHLFELVGDQIEDVLPIRLGGIAAIAVMPAELLQVVVQIAHRYLRSISFLRAAKIVVEHFLLLPRCMNQSGKCFCSPGAPMAAAGGSSEHGTPLPLYAVGLLLAGAAWRFVGVAIALPRGSAQSRESLTPDSRSAVKARPCDPLRESFGEGRCTPRHAGVMAA